MLTSVNKLYVIKASLKINGQYKVGNLKPGKADFIKPFKIQAQLLGTALTVTMGLSTPDP